MLLLLVLAVCSFSIIVPSRFPWRFASSASTSLLSCHVVVLVLFSSVFDLMHATTSSSVLLLIRTHWYYLDDCVLLIYLDGDDARWMMVAAPLEPLSSQQADAVVVRISSLFSLNNHRRLMLHQQPAADR